MDWQNLVPIVVALIGAGATILTFIGKQSADKHAEEAARQDRLEDRLDELEKRVDEEIRSRREAETKAHTLVLALEKAVDYIERVMNWLKAGATPPPPTPVDLDALKKTIRDGR